MTDAPPANPSHERLPEGHVVGRYTVRQWVRRGGMAEIYQAHHERTGAAVALKVVVPEHARNPTIQARFAREIGLLGRLAHVGNIVAVHDAGKLDDGRDYLVMPWIDGQDLDDVIALQIGRPLSAERIARIACDIASALVSMHAAKIVHRDLKPSNVMLDHGGATEVARVLDFGVSADLGETAANDDLTRGAVVGTEVYMPPEQASGLIRPDPSFDVWALGATVLHMLTGARPEPAQLHKGRVPDLDLARPDAPRALIELTRRCLRLDPNRRPTAKQAYTELSGLLAPGGFVPVADDPLGRTAGKVEGTIRRAGPTLEGQARVPTEPGVIGVAAGGLGDAGVERDEAAASVVPTQPGKLSESTGETAARARPEGAKRRRWPWGFAIGLAVGVAVVVAVVVVVGRRESSVDALVLSAGLVRPDLGGGFERPALGGLATMDELEPNHREAKKDLPLPSDDGGATPTTPRRVPAVAERQPDPSTPRPPAPDCAAIKQDVSTARAEKRWARVLSLTKKHRSCWPSTERVLLQMRTLGELGRWTDCVNAGAGLTDARIVRLSKYCRNHL